MCTGMKKFIPLMCFSKAYCLAERNRMYDGKEGNLILEDGTLKVREKRIKAPEESTQTLEEWKDSATRARDVIPEELNMGDGKEGPVMKYVVSQYVGWYDYWLKYPHLEQFWPVLKEWDPILRYDMWKTNLHDLMLINESEWNDRINMNNMAELKRLEKREEALSAAMSAPPKNQAKPSQPSQQQQQKLSVPMSSAKGKERAMEMDFRCMACGSDEHTFSQHPKAEPGPLIA